MSDTLKAKLQVETTEATGMTNGIRQGDLLGTPKNSMWKYHQKTMAQHVMKVKYLGINLSCDNQVEEEVMERMPIAFYLIATIWKNIYNRNKSWHVQICNPPSWDTYTAETRQYTSTRRPLETKELGKTTCGHK